MSIPLDDAALLGLLESTKPKQPPPKPIKRSIIHPAVVYNNPYVKIDWESPKYQCTFPHCKLHTHVTVQDVPYCLTHVAFPLIQINMHLVAKIKNLEDEINRMNRRVEC